MADAKKRRKSSRARPYTGALATPIPHMPPPALSAGLLTSGDPTALKRAFDELHERWITARANAVIAKLPALYKHFNVQEGNLPALMMALAIAHVPGFRFAEAPAGPKVAWNVLDVALLRFHIEEVQARNPSLSFAGAAKIVAKGGIWNEKLRRSGRASGETLRRRSLRADLRWVAMARDAFRYRTEFETPSDPPTVEEFVTDLLSRSQNVPPVNKAIGQILTSAR